MVKSKLIRQDAGLARLQLEQLESIDESINTLRAITRRLRDTAENSESLLTAMVSTQVDTNMLLAAIARRAGVSDPESRAPLHRC